jgi:tripartite-type tricarboxylate transporter receptor subunit TctC
MNRSKSFLERSFAMMLAGIAVNAGAASTVEVPADYPNKPIYVIVPAAPGTSPDAMARLIGEVISKSMGQPVIVENKPGASSTIGSAAVARAKPDGYTVLFTWTALIQSSVQQTRPPYDVFSDFAPITEVARSSFVLAGAETLPANTAKDFVNLAKQSPDKYSYGSYGNGTSSHILGELLKQSTGISMLHVPYKSGGSLMTDLMAGHIPIAFVDIGTARANSGAQRLKLLATTGKERSPYFKSVPTFAELGIQGLDLEGWYGVLAPAKTNPVIVQKLSQEITKAIRSPQITKKLEDLGVTVVASTPDAFAANLRRDEAMWRKIVTEASIRAE